MPSQPSAYKQMISVRVSKPLYWRLAKKAKLRHKPMSTLVRKALQNVVADTQLTPEEEEQIIRETCETMFQRLRRKIKG